MNDSDRQGGAPPLDPSLNSESPVLGRRHLLGGGLLMAGAAMSGREARAADSLKGDVPQLKGDDPAGPKIEIKKSYRALIRRNYETPAKIETVKLLPFGGRQVLVRNTANQCCYTDTGTILGPPLWLVKRPFPLIIGHGGMGVVEAVGPEVKSLKPGDKVLIACTAQCGLCYNCIRGRSDACYANFLQQGPVAVTSDGIPIVQQNGIGGLAEYTVSYEERLVPYFTDRSDEEMSLLIDVASTGLGMTCALHQIESGSSVVIFGCGPIGLSAVQGAKIQGASRIIVVEPVAMRRQLALKFGATDALDPNAFEGDGLVRRIREMCRGKTDRLFAGGRPDTAFGLGPDYVLEAVGRQRYQPKVESARDPTGLEALRQAFDLIPSGGWGMFCGGFAADDVFQLNAGRFTNGSKTIVSCQNGGIQTRRDIPRFIRLLEEGKFDAKSMVSEVVGFDDVVKAYQHVADRTVITAVVKFG